jgi:hypothetical protein
VSFRKFLSAFTKTLSKDKERTLDKKDKITIVHFKGTKDEAFKKIENEKIGFKFLL